MYMTLDVQRYAEQCFVHSELPGGPRAGPWAEGAGAADRVMPFGMPRRTAA